MVDQRVPYWSSRSLARKKKTILLVSTGDTCRSAMAAGFLRKLFEEQEIEGIDVKAAGVMTVTGLRASQEAIQVMEPEGVDLEKHRSSQLTPDTIQKADMILGMSPLHVQHALREDPQARGKTFLLKEYTKSDLQNIQVSDPMGCTLEVFKKCFQEIRDACVKIPDTDFVKKIVEDNKALAAQKMASEKRSPKKPEPKAPEVMKAEPKKKAEKKPEPSKKTPAKKTAPKKAAPKKAEKKAAPKTKAAPKKAAPKKAKKVAPKAAKKVSPKATKKAPKKAAAKKKKSKR